MPDEQPVRKPGIAEIARLSGVSAMTVSRVANNQPGVGDETRARVLLMMSELGFHINTSARALKIGRSGALGVICVASNFYGPSQVLFGVEQAARAADYTTTVVTLNEVTLESLTDAAGRLRQTSVEAIVIISPYLSSRDSLGVLSAMGIPAIAVWAPVDSGLAVASVDHVSSARTATQHLIDLGHRRIGHISGPLDWSGAAQRMTGWRDALHAAGLPVIPAVEGDWTAESGYRVALQMLDDPTVTGIFAANDQMALGVYRAAEEKGRRIPHDLSVVGYDDGPDSAFYSPPLTTVRQDFTHLGEHTFARVRAALTGGAGIVQSVGETNPPLIVRASTGTAPH